MEYLRTLKKRNFAVEYYNRFAALAKAYAHNQFDNATYRWLTSNGIKMQRHLGGLGVVSYKPAFSTYMIQGYQPIINTIPEIRSGKVHAQDLMMIDDMLVRYVGVMDEALSARKRELANPLLWIREGVQWILLIPLLLLKWFGLIGSSGVKKVASNFGFKLLAFIVALIGLIGSVVTIILGWDQFIEIVQAYMPLR